MPNPSETDAAVIVEPLRRTSLFADVAEPSLSRLAAQMSRETFGRDEMILHEGDSGDRLYILVEGRARVLLSTEDDVSETVPLAILHPGDTFGELSLLDGGPRSAGVQALTDVVVVG